MPKKTKALEGQFIAMQDLAFDSAAGTIRLKFGDVVPPEMLAASGEWLIADGLIASADAGGEE